MKKFVLILLGVVVSVIAAHVAFSQVPEGSITYEVNVNLHRTLPPERQEMKSMIPEFNTYRDRLVFRGSESLYKTIEDEEQDEFAADGGGVRMRFRRPAMEYYMNRDLGLRIRAQEFFGKKYLVHDSITIVPWKFGSGTKTIQGYECMEATYYNEERKQTVVAWYTSKLSPFLGPEGFTSLPGTILEININDGERVIIARKIDLQPLKKGDLKIPASGQKISEADFRQVVDDQMKKMGAQGGMIIRTN
jgi:GLPGLI family protein